MLDEDHLTLNKKILPSDKDHQGIDEYWHDKSLGYANDQTVKKADCPLNELDSLLGEEFFAKQFRGAGVEAYYTGKAKAIPDMVKEIRHNIETELYNLWKDGTISVIELQKVAKLLVEEAYDIKQRIETSIQKNEEDVLAIDNDCKANVAEWSDLNLLQRLANVGNRIYARHQTDLADLYAARTYTVALQFAKSLAAKTTTALENMSTDIGNFAELVNKAIEETGKLISAQQKKNKGLEDMKGAIVEVSEEETMVEFEKELRLDKTDMTKTATKLRQEILPKTPFTDFCDLTTSLSVDDITNAFDATLSGIVRVMHNEKAKSSKKVLGMNIITQLQQKLQTEEQINSFAYDIMQQSGVYLKLNRDQMNIHVRNNEGDRSPSNPASINQKSILVSIPTPETDSQKAFAGKLEKALRASLSQDDAQTKLEFDTTSLRQNELSVVTIRYCYPMRCADWLRTYKEKYKRFLNTDNKLTNRNNAILLHTEDDGAELPSLFVVENAEELIKQRKDEKEKNGTQTGPKVPEPPKPEPPKPEPIAEPQVQMLLYIGGQQYGPYDYKTLKSFVPTGQLTKDTLVWQQGMSTWLPAGQVPELQGLFASAAPVPPVPPTPSAPPVPPMPGA